MNSLIAIALGGSVGALTRYWMGNGIYAVLGRSFPIGTLVINVSGSFLMGLLSELMMVRFPVPVEYRAAILVGFLGAYTTFSTFALETYALMEEGSHLKATLNMLLSVVLSVGAVWVGMLAARLMFSGDLQPLEGQGWLLLKLTTVFVVTGSLALMAELGWRNLQYPAVWHEVTMVVLLALSSLCATGLTVIGLSASSAMLPVWFAIHASLSALAVGSGMWLGRLE